MSGHNKSLFPVGLGMLLSGSLAIALDDESKGDLFSSDLSIEEIIVTTQKRSENMQEVPIAVSVFIGDDLKQSGISGTQALQQVTPSLVFNNTSAIAQPYLRGIGTRLSLMGLESSVATYNDDRYISRPAAAMLDLADVERVEVLKGPQGTLYGRNATGGAIRIISRDPGDEEEGVVTLGIGNFKHRKLSGSGTLIISDSVKTRLTGLVVQRDGYVDNIVASGEDEFDDKYLQAYRAKTRWHISDDSNMMLNLNYWRRDDHDHNDVVDLSPAGLGVGAALGGITTADPDKTATLVRDNLVFEEFAGQLRFDWRYDDFDLVSITTYSRLEGGGALDVDATSLRSLDLLTTEESETWSQELQWISEAGEKWQWLAGVYYFQQEGRFTVFSDLADLGLLPPGVIGTQGRQSVVTETWALFGQSTYQFTDRWALTLGARWNTEEKDAITKTIAGVFSITGQTADFSDDDSWSEFTPKVSLEYQADVGLLYLTYARGFKSGGYNYPAFGNSSLDPEILDMLELGVKLDLWDQRLRFNCAIYYYDYEDLQVSRAAGGSGMSVLLVTENAANAKAKGLEADILFLITSELSLDAGFSWLDSEYKDYAASANVYNASVGLPGVGMTGIAFDADGEPLLRAPDLSAYISLSYQLQTESAEFPLVVTASYKDEYDFDFVGHPDTETLTQDSYSIVNATLGYIPHNKNWEISFWINNLTDKDYFDDLVASSQGVRGSPGAPRNYGIDISISF